MSDRTANAFWLTHGLRTADTGRSIEDLSDLSALVLLFDLLLLDDGTTNSLDIGDVGATGGRSSRWTRSIDRSASRDIGASDGDFIFLLILFLGARFLSFVSIGIALVASLVSELALDTVGIDVAVLADDDTIGSTCLLLEITIGVLISESE